MRNVIACLTAFFLLCSGAVAQVGLPFPGPGAASAATYQGPGDVYSGTGFAWYSPARAISATFATSAGPIADIVDTATGTAACTIPIGTNGFANLTATVCPTGSPTVNVVTFCTVTHAAGCSISKLYDQTGNGRHVIQATLASMPLLSLSSTPKGTLPAVNCGTGTQVLATTAAFTQAQPFTMSAVVIRNSGTLNGGAIGASPGNAAFIGAPTGANLATVVSGGTLLSAAATDNTWYSLQGLLNGAGTASAINVNTSDTPGATGTTGFSAANIRVCRAGAIQFAGLIAEGGIWIAASTATDRNNLSTNQHGASGYNF